MGEPVVPPEHGNRCDGFVEPDETPAFIYVYFWGIISCPGQVPFPNCSLFKLHQEALVPCMYKNVDSGSVWDVQLQISLAPIRPVLHLWHDNGFAYFSGLLFGFPSEHDIMDNGIVDCEHEDGGHSGFATYFWLDALDGIVTGFNIPQDGNLLFEFFMKDDTDPVYKLCDRLYSLNQKFLLGP